MEETVELKKFITPIIIIGLLIIGIECFGSGFDELNGVLSNIEEGTKSIIKKIYIIAGIISTGFFVVSIHAGFSKIIGIIIGAGIFASLSIILQIAFSVAG